MYFYLVQAKIVSQSETFGAGVALTCYYNCTQKKKPALQTSRIFFLMNRTIVLFLL